MSADAAIWQGPSEVIPVTPESSSLYVESQTATAGQTLFTLATFNYTPNTGTLLVFQNSGLQRKLVDYVETSGNQVTMNVAANVGDSFIFLSLAVSDVPILQTPAGANSVGYDLGTVQTVLQYATPLATYAALRAYNGALALNVRITNPGIEGYFRYDSSDVVSADDSGTTIVDVLGRRWKRVYSSDINVAWFGAAGDGVTDDTAVFNAAHTVALSLNKKVYFTATPAGYLIAGTILAKVSMSGDGTLAVLITNSLNADVIQCADDQSTFSDFAITTPLVRTGGYYINFNGVANANNYSRVQRVLMSNWFNAIGVLGGGSTGYRLDDCILVTNVPGGIGVVVSTTGDAVDVIGSRVLILGPTAGPQCVSGFQVQNVGDIAFSHCSTVKTGIGANFVPQNGQRIQCASAIDCLFDSGSGAGVQINPAAGGVIDLIKIIGGWSCTNANGISLAPSNTGLTKRVELHGFTYSGNTNIGLIAGGGGTVTSLLIVGGSSSANLHGNYFGAGTTRIIMIGHTGGPCGEFAANTGYAVVLEAGCDNFIILANVLLGNGLGAISDATTSGPTRIIQHNVGYVTQNKGSSAIASGTTSITINHGLSRIPSVGDFSINLTGNTTVFVNNIWISGITPTQFTVNCGTNPGASGMPFDWAVRII